MELKNFDGGRLNLSGFITNPEPMTEQEFHKAYVESGEYEIYTQKSIKQFQDATANELIKGEMGADGLKAAQSQLQSLEQVEFQKGDTVIGVFVRKKDRTDDNLEKGAVTESFASYNSNKLSFTKTGKEISTQISSVLLPLLEAQKIKLENDLKEISKDIDIEPDSWIDEYEYKGFAKVLPKVGRYSWDVCEPKWDSVSQTRGAETEEHKNCRKYNDIARQLVSTLADIQYSQLLSRNLNDTKKYEITADQLLALQF